MQASEKNSREGLHSISDTHRKLIGVDTFIKNIEKDFFTEVSIRNYRLVKNTVGLVIYMHCNFQLPEVLHHFKKEIWGGFYLNEMEGEASSFSKHFNILQEQNDMHIDIDELALFLSHDDVSTAIVINKIYKESIPEHLDAIFNSIMEHYANLTWEFTELPYEIYIPVYDENVTENDIYNQLDVLPKQTVAKSYYNKYWGLYFESEEEAVVYDLDAASIINADLQILNQ